MNEWQQAEQHADRALEFFDRGYLEEAESELRKALEIQFATCLSEPSEACDIADKWHTEFTD